MRGGRSRIAALRAFIRATALLVAGAIVPVGAPPALAQQQSFDGFYKGSWECESMPSGVGFRMFLVVSVRRGSVLALVPMLDAEGKQEEPTGGVAAGAIAADGTYRISGVVYAREATFRGDYTGTIDGTGGTMTGTQVWTFATNGDTVTRDCRGTVVKVGSSDR
jgi:hypothetical protein